MKEFPHIIKDLNEWPIAQFYRDRPGVVRKVAKMTVDKLKGDNADISSVLNQTIYAEKVRSRYDSLKVDPPDELGYWKRLENELSQGVREDINLHDVQQEVLNKIVNRYSEEIPADFNPKTFDFARRVLTFLFRMIYNPFMARNQRPLWGTKEQLLDKLTISGPMDQIRGLFDKGTVCILPTHFSNLDSIFIGYVIEKLSGLPAFSYGAGLNLFDYELLAYYMSRLGAYTVDRRKRNPIYAETRRQFFTSSIQEGVNNIFFPGGTRSRGGMLEKKLKLGLLGTLVESQNEFYLRNYNKKIIVVPMVVSYHFVLEARSLIEQYLRKLGKENYLSKSKKKNTSMKNIRFLRRMFARGSEATLSFGHPIDIFGNDLDENGESIKAGRRIDIRDYFVTNDRLTYDPQRNRVYTRHLGELLVKSYEKENVVLSSHLVTFVTFQIFKKQNPGLDLFTLLTLPEEYLDIPIDLVYRQIDRLRDILMEKRNLGLIKICHVVDNGSAQQIFDHALKNLNSYHFYEPLKKAGEKVRCEDLKLLYYYHNRLSGYGLEDDVDVKGEQTFKVSSSIFA